MWSLFPLAFEPRQFSFAHSFRGSAAFLGETVFFSRCFSHDCCGAAAIKIKKRKNLKTSFDSAPRKSINRIVWRKEHSRKWNTLRRMEHRKCNGGQGEEINKHTKRSNKWKNKELSERFYTLDPSEHEKNWEASYCFRCTAAKKKTNIQIMEREEKTLTTKMR